MTREEAEKSIGPCAHCGWDAPKVISNAFVGVWGIKCKNSSCCASVYGFGLLESAVIAWNRRPS